jgi:predicted negative regulator of RcsB-dependent stress response
MLEYLLLITAIIIMSLVFNNYRTMKNNKIMKFKKASYSRTMTNIEKNDFNLKKELEKLNKPDSLSK